MSRTTKVQKRVQTRAALLRAAVEVFTIRGYTAASLDEISDQAGYSTGAVYSNFDGKEGLFLACLDYLGVQQLDLWERFIEHAGRRGANEDEIADVVRSVVLDRGWRRAVLEFGTSPKSARSRAQLMASQQGWRQIVQRMLEAVAHGNHLLPTLSFETGAEIVSGLFDGLIVQDVNRPDNEVAALVSVAVRLVLGDQGPLEAATVHNSEMKLE